MFYEHIKRKWQAGEIRVGLPAKGHGDKISIEAKGLTALAAGFLSQAERTQLAELAKENARITSIISELAQMVSNDQSGDLLKVGFVLNHEGEKVKRTQTGWLAEAYLEGSGRSGSLWKYRITTIEHGRPVGSRQTIGPLTVH
jgi:hypothetical protein